MDLHDYKDVAENYDRYLEVMYETNNNHEGFEDFYLEMAKKYGGQGVVDIACGTGAVLLYLAERGIEIDGTDLSEEMCRVASEKSEKMGLHLNIFPADMTKFDSGRKYSLAIIARSGFMHLQTPELQRTALLNIRKQLVDGGILTLNTFDPFPPIQAAQMSTGVNDYTFRLEYVNSEGKREKIYNAIAYNPVSQVMSGNWKFETLDENGNVIEERIRPLTMRQTYRQEMKWLIELCGFELVEVYQNYKWEKAGDNAVHNLIWVLRKAGFHIVVDGVPQQRYWINLMSECKRENIPDVIRHMSMEEIPECVNVIRKSFQTVADEFGITKENAPRFTAFATDEDRIRYQFCVEKRPMYVFLHHGQIVGYYSLALLKDGEIELNNLSVLPEFRHRGIGHRLLKDCFEKASQLGAGRVNIGIVEENTVLRKWYESYGFNHIRTQKYDFFPFTCGYMEKII